MEPTKIHVAPSTLRAYRNGAPIPERTARVLAAQQGVDMKTLLAGNRRELYAKHKKAKAKK